jgi:YVTN family beta-propeller protein
VATYGGAVVIDTATDSVIASIDVGPSVGIAVSPDGTHLYVTHYGYSPAVSVVDTATDALVGTINVGNVPEYPAIIGAPQLDHWQNTLGGNWAIATSWNHGTPTASISADIDATGSYSLAITTNDVAYELFLNDAQATVTDGKGGVLTLSGPGGATTPNGALNINAGTFVLNGGALKAGIISISAGGTFLIANGSYTGVNVLSESIIDGGSLIDSTTATVGSITGTGTILAENKANLTIAGTLSGSEVFTIANTAHVLITSPVNGKGSFIIANSGVLELGASDSENVTFASGASGTLKLDHSLTAPFTGTISGLTPNDRIDLADLPWVSGKMQATYSGNSAGGTLTVTDGSQRVSLKLSGDYTNATWVLSKDKTGGTTVVDPPANTSPDVFAYATTGPYNYITGGYGDPTQFGIVDLTTGVFTPLGNLGLTLGGLAVGPGGVLYGGAGQTLYSVNPTNGALTAVGTSSLGYYDVGSTTSGLFEVGTDFNLYSINPNTGALTLIGPTGLDYFNGLSTGSDTLYLTSGSTLYTLNTTTGAATLVGSAGTGIFGAVVVEGGIIYGGSASPLAIYTLNGTTVPGPS